MRFPHQISATAPRIPASMAKAGAFSAEARAAPAVTMEVDDEVVVVEGLEEGGGAVDVLGAPEV
jgi:hypothetical protein